MKRVGNYVILVCMAAKKIEKTFWFEVIHILRRAYLQKVERDVKFYTGYVEGYHFSIEDIRNGYFPTKTGGWNRNLGPSLLVEKRFEERGRIPLRTKNKRSFSSLCPNLSSYFAIYLLFFFHSMCVTLRNHSRSNT